ncbi:RNA-directed DNA polymerase, eukaryota, reverse transcriptase zinc-binding domain protein [Tanacetum coccineum]
MSNLSHNKANSKSIEDLDEIKVHNEEKQFDGDDLGAEEMGIHVDDCDVNNNVCLDSKEVECNVISDNGPKSGMKDKECLDENKMTSDEIVDVNKTDDKEDLCSSEMEMTNSFRGNQVDKDVMINNSPKQHTDMNRSSKKTYASAAKGSSYFETNKLDCVPIEINEIREEVVIFDDEIVELGSKKWELTLCGHLIGHYMSLPALNYHLRRMWYRYVFKEIVDNGNGNWLFKFTNEQGMLTVANQIPWMVNSKPLMVYKRNPSVGMKMAEHKKVRISQKSQENGQSRTNTDTGTDKVHKSRGFDSKKG